MFGGGYDAAVYDEEDVSARDYTSLKGNGIYIVNAKTGKYIWSYDGFDLKDSIPSSIRVLDIDRNGSIDRLYFGDLGGNVWRVDLNVDETDGDEGLYDVKQDARIYKLANLGGNSGDKRKFFHEPEVSLFKHQGSPVVTVSIGSGYRAHPLNTSIEDRLYVLYDENVMSSPKDAPQPLTESSLTTPDALGRQDFLPKYKGWYKDLTNSNGEKVLSTPLIFLDKVMFTTFGLTALRAHTTDACAQTTNNESRAYALDLMTGAPTADLDGDGIITDKDESIVIGSGEIPETPQLVFNKPTNCTKDGCDQFVDVRIGKMETPLINKDTVGGNVNLRGYLPKVFWLNSEQ